MGKRKNYVITSAQYDASVNKEFLSSLETYCKHNNAELLILPMEGASIHEDYMSPILKDQRFVTTRKRLNDKIQISKFNIKPQQIDPITGLARFTQSDMTTIFASPKQRMKVIPNSNIDLPKILMTTGAVTRPNYRDNRQGEIATRDHVYGAIVVEIDDDAKYHYRQLTATTQGHFIDLGVKYAGKTKPEDCTLEALVLGDLHIGDTDVAVRDANYDMIKELKPRRVVIHDFFNGHSINHHEQDNLVLRAQESKNGRLSLEDELKTCAKELQELSNAVGKEGELILVASNHDEFLDRYLRECRFKDEPNNAYVGAMLLVNAIEGKHPLEEGMRMYCDIPSNVKFIKRDQDYKVWGWQLGSHGDKGSNGSRGSVRSKEWAHGKSITGHSHTPEIQRNTYVVGTSTRLRLSYTVGPSSWMNTHAMLYANGKAQLVNTIDGKWRKKKR